MFFSIAEKHQKAKLSISLLNCIDYSSIAFGLIYYMFFSIAEKHQKARGTIIFFNCIDYYSIASGLIFYMFFSIAEKNQKARLTIIFLNSTGYSTNASRPLLCAALFGRLPFHNLWIATEIIDRSGFDMQLCCCGVWCISIRFIRAS